LGARSQKVSKLWTRFFFQTPVQPQIIIYISNILTCTIVTIECQVMKALRPKLKKGFPRADETSVMQTQKKALKFVACTQLCRSVLLY
jgi:hypothetical protein